MKMGDKYRNESPEASSEEEEVSDMDSDEELQRAFARGDLKPGSLVVQNKDGNTTSGRPKPVLINNLPVLKLKLESIKLPSKYGWLERLDIVNDVAPLAPEIALQLDEHKEKRTRQIKAINNKKSKKSSPAKPTKVSTDEDTVHNDFVREMTFYRQAQQAIMKCLPRLKNMGVPTRRPDDYFAEMAKSDSHMQKVARVLLKKQTSTERAEKVRRLREQKKFAKQTQVHVLQERQKAKKDMMDSVKKYRKGQKNNLDFLDDAKESKAKAQGKRGPQGPGGAAGGSSKGPEKRVNRRRLVKNETYGYGGQRKGSKWNTRDSLDNFDDGKSRGGGGKGGPRGKGRVGGGGKGKGGGRPFSSGRGAPPKAGGGGGGKRPGKQVRQRMKTGK